jgi:Transposase DDE domain
LVINVECFLKYSNIFEGNTTDSKTLETILQGMTKNAVVSTQKPVVVMDAGISTDANLAMLKAQGYDYMCVTRNKLKHYNIDTACKSVIVTDNKKQTIELQKIIVEGSDDTFLQVKSKAKELKEQSMNSRFTQRFEDGLKQINDALKKKSGIKKIEKVHERIGRLKQKHTTTHKHYNITVATDSKGKATNVTWQQKAIEQNHGTYFLRTTLNHKQEENQWKIYNAIREIEYTFRTLKTDIDLRPIYHKTDEAAMAHLHLGLLAYWAVNTIRYQLKQKEINTQWKDVVRTMNTQKSVTTSIKNNLTTTIQIRQCSEPNTKVTAIYDALKFKHKPYYRKKFVVPPA